MILEIHTDGACSGNQNKENIGGWGAILSYGIHEKEIYGGEANTTNNRMELTALIEALQSVKKPNQIIYAYSDSSYLVNCFREGWYLNWEKNGWKTANKKHVENSDLWQKLIPLVNSHYISFFRVKGHINLNSKSTDFDKLLSKFKEWNGSHMTFADFTKAVTMNNRADALANKAMDELR